MTNGNDNLGPSVPERPAARPAGAPAPPVVESAPAPPPPSYPPAAMLAPEQPEHPQQSKAAGRGKRLARAVGVPVAVLLAVGGYQAIKEADRGENGEIAREGDLASNELKVGDCLKIPQEGEVKSLKAVPCDQPHDGEAFAEVAIKAETFPGDAKVSAFADRACVRRFQGFVGVPLAKSTLGVTFLTPLEASWDRGDRKVTCLVAAPEGQTVKRSLEGSKR